LAFILIQAVSFQLLLGSDRPSSGVNRLDIVFVPLVAFLLCQEAIFVGMLQVLLRYFAHNWQFWD